MSDTTLSSSRAVTSHQLEAEAFDAGQARGEVAGFAAGEGVGERAGGLAERHDVLAWIDRRIANARAVGRVKALAEDEVRAAVRQMTILRDEIAGGQHEGCSFVAAALGEGAGQ